MKNIYILVTNTALTLKKNIAINIPTELHKPFANRFEENPFRNMDPHLNLSYYTIKEMIKNGK